MPSLISRLQRGWNAFLNKDPTKQVSYRDGPSSYGRPDRLVLTRGHAKTVITAVLNRISIDAAGCKINHVRLDDYDRYLEDIDSGLNNCLDLEANTDQTGRAFVQDLIMSLLDEGCVAAVPVVTNRNPEKDTFDVECIRVGKIVEWKPQKVKVELYNEWSGKKEQIWLDKSCTAIIENPFYAVMNEPNSTVARLNRKLTLLDMVDEQNGAGKLDLIIQLPYTIRSDARRKQAEERRENIELQLASSKYGIAYADATEHITQLNRPVENQLLTQIDTLTRTLYSQLGITEEILNGSADEKTMNNYYSRTIEPILSAVVDEMKRKFLSKTARSQKQSIAFFNDPFKLVPTTELAELADKLTRNEIMTSNEFRQVVGMRPSKDPNADALRNKNISAADDATLFDVDGNVIKEGDTENKEEHQNG